MFGARCKKSIDHKKECKHFTLNHYCSHNVNKKRKNTIKKQKANNFNGDHNLKDDVIFQPMKLLGSHPSKYLSLGG